MILYTVQKGDSLWKIARRHNIGLDSLIAANPQLCDPNSILVGQQLNVPCPWPSPAQQGVMTEGPDYPFCDQPGAGRPCIYPASAGETLETIAHRFMCPLTHLAFYNMGYGKREPLPQGARIVIPGENGMTPQNGITPQNSVMQQNGMTPHNGMMNDVAPTEPWGVSGAGAGCGKQGCRNRR